jgi:hypothetical protein
MDQRQVYLLIHHHRIIGILPCQTNRATYPVSASLAQKKSRINKKV